MNIMIITSSFPSASNDPAGAFIKDFVIELTNKNENVVVLTVPRKKRYDEIPKVTLEFFDWQCGDKELASLNFFNPFIALRIIEFFIKGKNRAMKIVRKWKIDRIFCMWAIPSGVFGYYVKKKLGIEYDVWCLGSDIYKIGGIPIIGKLFIKSVISKAKNVYADGFKLCDDVKKITGRKCDFLASSRILPPPAYIKIDYDDSKINLLFVGRYHFVKGVDILLKAFKILPDSVKDKIHLFMFGIGSLSDFIGDFIGRNNLETTVSFSGPVDAKTLSTYFSFVDFLVIPSRRESIPVVFSEAVQKGVPIVATPVGDLPYLINKYKCGLVSDKVSAKSFSEVIIKVIQNGKSPYLDGVKEVSQLFDIRKSVESWLRNIYGKI